MNYKRNEAAERLPSFDSQVVMTSVCIKCPDCGSIFNHINGVEFLAGNDNYEAGWWGRGDLVVIEMWCEECQPPSYNAKGFDDKKWYLLIGFHKGNSYMLCQGSRVNYRQYILSDAWKEKAVAAKERAGNRCQVCNRNSDTVTLHAHHRTYERLGSELDDDITVLCKDCHKLYEENKKRIKS